MYSAVLVRAGCSAIQILEAFHFGTCAVRVLYAYKTYQVYEYRSRIPAVSSLLCTQTQHAVLQHDNSLLNMPNGRSKGWGFACRYLWPAATGRWNRLPMPIYSITST